MNFFMNFYLDFLLFQTKKYYFMVEEIKRKTEKNWIDFTF